MRSAWGPLMDEAIRCFADGVVVARTLDPPEPAAMAAVARSAGAV
jgi:hypothetical protein